MKKILVHAHIYYINLWQELLDCINNIPYPYDLYITTVESNKDFAKDLKKQFPSAHIEIVANKGYDVGPFIHVLKQVNLKDYSYIIKLHTKRDISLSGQKTYIGCITKGPNWRNMLLDPFRTTARIRKIVETMEKNPNIGIVANHKILRDDKQFPPIPTSEKNVNEALKKLGFSKPKTLIHVAGTMFIARAKIFTPIAKSSYTIDDFPIPDKQHTGGSLAHTFERLLCYIPQTQGYKVVDCYTPKIIQLLHKIKISKKFKIIYENTITDSNKHLIKILKIPVWHKQLTE